MARGGARGGRAASGERRGGGRCGAPGAAHSRGLPTACGFSAAQTGPRRLPTAEGGLQMHMHFAEGCLVNPASCPASLATLRTRAFLEVTQKRQKGNRAATAGRDIHWSPPRQRKSKGPSEGRELLRGLSRGWLASRPEGVARPRWGRLRPRSCRGVLGDGEVAVGPAGTLLRGEPRRQLNGSPVCARVSAPLVSRIRRSSAADT